MSTLNVKVLTDPGEWIPGFSKFVKKGTVVSVDAYVVKNKLAKLKKRFEVTDAEAKLDATKPAKLTEKQVAAIEEKEATKFQEPGSEIWELDFPNREQLHAAGLTTVDGLKALIADGGDAWFKAIEGVGQAGAKAIVEHIAKLKPVE